MDKINSYRTSAKEIIEYLGELWNQPNDPIAGEVIIDNQKGHYLLFSNGWRNEEYRVYGCTVHIEVKSNGRVWLHHDGTDMEIGRLLMEKGIPKSDIVLGFHAPFQLVPPFVV